MSEVNNDIEVEIKPQIFWLEDFEGSAQGGYFIRNMLKDFFIKLEENGKTPVGIKYNGSYNLEILVKNE
jgi:hypothetical protein